MIAFCAIVLYYPSLQGGFISDDFSYLSFFVTLEDGLAYASGIPASSLFGYYRPVSDTVFALVEWLGGGTRAHHCISILLHAINSGLAFLLFQRFLKTSMAFMGVLIFMTLPTNVQPVAWVSGRSDLLMVFFFLLALLALERYLADRRHKWWFLLAVFSYFGAMGSKETAVTFPLIAGLLSMYRQPSGTPLKSAMKDAVKIVAVFFIAPLVLFALRLAFVHKIPQVVPNMNVDMVPVHFLLSLFAFFFRSIPAHVFGNAAPVLVGFFLLGVFGTCIIGGFKATGKKKDRVITAAYLLSAYFAAILAFVLVAGWPGPDLQRARYFYFPGLVFAFSFASVAQMFAGSVSNKAMRPVVGIIILTVVVFTLTTRAHIQTYNKAAEYFDAITTRFMESFPEVPAARIALFVPFDYKGAPMMPYGFAEALTLKGKYGATKLDIKTYPLEASRDGGIIERLRSGNRLPLKYSIQRKSFFHLSEQK